MCAETDGTVGSASFTFVDWPGKEHGSKKRRARSQQTPPGAERETNASPCSKHRKVSADLASLDSLDSLYAAACSQVSPNESATFSAAFCQIQSSFPQTTFPTAGSLLKSQLSDFAVPGTFFESSTTVTRTTTTTCPLVAMTESLEPESVKVSSESVTSTESKSQSSPVHAANEGSRKKQRTRKKGKQQTRKRPKATEDENRETDQQHGNDTDNPEAGSKLKCARKPCKRDNSGKHEPPLLEPGSVVQVKPTTPIQLIFAVKKNEAEPGSSIVYTADTGSARFFAVYADQLCTVTPRYFERFYDTGLTYQPPAHITQDHWSWSFVKDGTKEPVPYCEASRALLSDAFASRKQFGVFLPAEQHSVCLVAIFGFFAIPTPETADDYLYRYKVIFSYPDLPAPVPPPFLSLDAKDEAAPNGEDLDAASTQMQDVQEVPRNEAQEDSHEPAAKREPQGEPTATGFPCPSQMQVPNQENVDDA
jgi:hypothetical protein